MCTIAIWTSGRSGAALETQSRPASGTAPQPAETCGQLNLVRARLTALVGEAVANQLNGSDNLITRSGWQTGLSTTLSASCCVWPPPPTPTRRLQPHSSPRGTPSIDHSDLAVRVPEVCDDESARLARLAT